MKAMPLRAPVQGVVRRRRLFDFFEEIFDLNDRIPERAF
jgi:hypothetical protein